MTTGESSPIEVEHASDLPLESAPRLSYRSPGMVVDSWRLMLQAFTIAAVVLGVAQLTGEIALLGRFGLDRIMSLAAYTWGSHATSTSAWLNIGEILGDAAGAVFLVGAVGCQNRRGWARLTMIAGAIIYIAGTTCICLHSILRELTPSTMRYRAEINYTILYVIVSDASRLVLPVMIVWFMRLPQVRQQFGRQQV
jgi:hypothetical protein